MNFNEALEFKKTIGDTYMHENIVCKVMVVPESQNDFDEYALQYLNYGCTDESAKDFSRNSEFAVYALYKKGSVLLPIRLSSL